MSAVLTFLLANSKAILNGILALPELIKWFREMQGSIKGTPKEVLTDVKEVTKELKELKKGDKKGRAAVGKRFSDHIGKRLRKPKK